MLHKFLEPGDWFAPKKLGYGAGWPIAWQGWALLAFYMVIVLGIGIAMEALGGVWIMVGVILIFLVTLPVLWVAKRRTKGGWKMRL